MIYAVNLKKIFTSTSEIYGKLNKVPFREDMDRLLGTPQTNRWCYSTSKSLVEHYITANGKDNNLKYIIFRLFNVYGLVYMEELLMIFLKNLYQIKN